MLRGSVLALVAVLNVEVIWDAFVAQTIDVETVLLRLVISVPIVACLVAFVRAAMRPQQVPQRPPTHGER